MIILAVSIDSNILAFQNAVAEDDKAQPKLTVTTDNTYYSGRFPVNITGIVSTDVIQEGKTVKITVYNPSNEVYKMAEANVSPIDGSYSYIMKMEEYDLPTGNYRIVSEYRGYTAEITFYFSEDKNRPRTYQLEINSKTYDITFSIFNGRLESILANPKAGTIDFNILSEDSGGLELTLPNELIYNLVGYNGFSGYFLDGEFFSNPEKYDTASCNSQQYQVDFEKGTKTITLGQDPEWRLPKEALKGFPFVEYLKVQSETFYIRGLTNGHGCEFTFVGNERKLHIDIQSPSNEDGYFLLTLSSELIPMIPEIIVDGDEVDFSVIRDEEEDEDEEHEESEIYSIEFEYPSNSKSIDIIGKEKRGYRFSYPLVEERFTISVAHNPPLKPISIGDELIVTANVQGYLEGYDHLVYVVQVLDEQGMTESISITNRPIYTGTIYADLRSIWEPEKPGKFRIEAFVLANDGDESSPIYKILMKKMTIPSFEVLQDNTSPSGRIINVSKDSGNSSWPEMVAVGENVYLVWANYEPGVEYDEDDLMFSKSSDGGTTFLPAVKISDSGVQAQRDKSLVAYEKNIYVSWVAPPKQGDKWKPGELFFTKSNDEGKTFSRAVQLSDGPVSSHVLAAIGNNIYAVWQTYEEQGKDSIMFRASNNGGETFGPIQTLEDNEQVRPSHPDLAVTEKEVFVTWHMQRGESFSMMFAKSNDFGKTFSDPSELDFGGWGDSDIKIVGNKIYILANMNMEYTISDNKFVASDVVLSMSNDGGTTFEEPVNISNSFGETAPIKIITTGKNDENVYVLYADGIFEGANYFAAKSSDGGKTFGKPLYLLGYDSYPIDMETDGENVFLLWSEDYYAGDYQNSQGRLFISSIIDKEKELGLVNTKYLVSSSRSIYDVNLEVSNNERIYVAWQDFGTENQDILFTKSVDGGITFHEGVNILPMANAGPDVVVNEGGTVTLDGSKSYDPDNTGNLSFFWNHVDGFGVDISETTNPIITITIPMVGEDSTSTVVLTVNDGRNESFRDYITIHIKDIENHFIFTSAARVTLDRSLGDFSSGEYDASVKIFSKYVNAGTGIELDKNSFSGTLIITDLFEADPDFEQMEIQLKIESVDVSDDLKTISYSASPVGMSGQVSGKINFSQPVDFRGQYSPSSEDMNNTMTLELDGAEFQILFGPGGYFIFD